MDILNIIKTYDAALWHGLQVTVGLCIIIWSSGLIIGGGFGVVGAAHPKTVGRVFEYSSYFIRAIPALVLLFWFHYPFQYLLGITVPPFITAALTLSLMSIFLVSDLVRSVLQQFPTSYVESAKVCGINQTHALLYIKMPIILRQLIPPILGIMIQMLQATLFASLISVEELFRVSQRINSIEYKPVEVYTGMAIFFVLICLPVNVAATWLQERFNKILGQK
jgi:His/Glu/Gln/Arg/opine family amino acid ABC transporter permease subunit